MFRVPRRTLLSLFLPILLTSSGSASLAEDLPPAGGAPRRSAHEPSREAARQAPVTPPLTPESAVRLSMLADGSLRARLLEVEVSAGRLAQARRLPDPELEVELRRPSREKDGPGTRAEAALGWDLSAVLGRRPVVDAARAELDAARARAAAALARHAFEVESTFHGLVAARRKLELARTRTELAEVGADAARAVADAGGAAPLSPLREAARREAATFALAEAGLSVVEAEERLVALLGGGAVPGVHDAVAGVGAEAASPAPQAVELAGLEESAVAASLELAELRARLGAAEARARLARAESRRPGLEIRLLAEREEGAWTAGAGLSLRLPVFDRGRGRIAALEAEVQSIQELLSGTEVLVRSSARIAAARLLAAHARAERLTGPVRAFHERMTSETLLHANAMQVGIPTLLSARDSALRAEADAVDALRNLAIADAAVRALRAGVRPDAAAPRPGPSTVIATAEGGH